MTDSIEKLETRDFLMRAVPKRSAAARLLFTALASTRLASQQTMNSDNEELQSRR